jgi:tetratricopeptide (TPR) repeat protein
MTPASLLAARRCERLVREGSARYLRLDIVGAEPLLRAALAEAERSGRPRAIARAAQSLYYLLRREGRHSESVAALQRMVDAHRRLDGVDGRWTAEWRDELVGLYGRLGRRGELEALCDERLESEVRRHGRQSVEVAWALLTLAWALRGAARWEESEERCREALAVLEDLYGCDHPRMGWALTGLALAREHAGDLSGAEAALHQARANWERTGHADRVAAIDELLIDLYLRQRRDEEALAVSAALLAGRPCPNDERRLCGVERQAALARALGRDDEAATWEAEARQLRGAIERRGRERERLGDGAPETPTATSCGAARLTGPIFPSPLL